MNPLTLAELKLRQAQLAAQAERLRQEARALPFGARSANLTKRVKDIQARADDYAAILAAIETKELRKAS